MVGIFYCSPSSLYVLYSLFYYIILVICFILDIPTNPASAPDEWYINHETRRAFLCCDVTVIHVSTSYLNTAYDNQPIHHVYIYMLLLQFGLDTQGPLLCLMC